ncbi:Rne/Rng family ribonuclease [Desulfurispira natronophila]|uniref:Ribonuclease G n=1 Tax=Desulfurispira natronophila TaxID=682562 RepID=A0A7W7Y2Q5_9BACT|nr:Rne/Rng family ribonuclease [Desulfurispira natronophila]MBB5020944.1 ribonuclease G [Desulfurispira natronophila]
MSIFDIRLKGYLISTTILINHRSYETRLAYLENNELSEIMLERRRESGVVGNIYKGIVSKVLPGMQAAFVDIGLERSAFLYVADLGPDLLNNDSYTLPDEIAKATVDGQDKSRNGDYPPIDQFISVGDELIVQVAKDPIASKGARITTYITLPGRHLVLMPTIEHIGISRRISNEAERSRLRKTLTEIKPEGMGVIARTVAEHREIEDFIHDRDFLVNLWHIVEKTASNKKAPTLLYQDLDLILKTMRDLFTREVERVCIDDENEYLRCREFAARLVPQLQNRIEFYRDQEPIFDAFNIEVEVNKLGNKKVWLKSGGYIVIDQTEALTAIDINTGRYVGKKNLEDTILQTNLEAAREICCQLRLRNIGGIIIIDFIDMDHDENRQRVLQALTQGLSQDRAKTNILPISELGLVEMTRKRVRDSIGRVLHEPCHYCDGKGHLKSPHTVCYEIFREIQRISAIYRGKKLYVEACAEVADIMFSEEAEYVEKLEQLFCIKLVIKSNPHFHQEHFEIVPL